ncbi:DNA helicase-2/ATP-dependent DNA helicase PcrA [Symbiobacterium terraclitae]|uniref:DNA 3'-5' helicase n=1 Tax=Symbiobacterium terraclitae TaxID=557451 RepID=A0ABS4JT37_9FIRM|nr:ATP-dependent helicase [Symbiobacterium terraclitae]MBP2018678.1 DNA helicase-2/ATP-dependent DNA helicase PcrA [Symbiobacterium terraclitae]
MNPIPFNLNDLTDEQQRVVTHADGPAVVIACPGSGKTRALTQRMGYLVHRGVPPAAILGITFTRAAAAEMKARLARLIPPAMARQVRLFTFHGLAYQILKAARGRPNVLDERAQKAMAGQLLREFELNADQPAVECLLTDFAFLVGAQIPLEQFRPGSCDPERFRQIWDRYGELKAERGLVDFDDLIVLARDLLRNTPAHRRALVARIRHLLVDEFQDTNALQWEFLQLLIPAGDNLMVVGDDDQAIYGWRGASPSFMLDFPRRFPGCATLRLSRNFRSTASIIAPAARLIAFNTRRFAKEFVAERAPAQPPGFVRPEDAADEADRITAAIREQLAAGADPTQLAVLYRTHLLAYPLMNRLDRAGIPYRVIGGRPNPFTRWMARDALAYLRWAYGEASLEEIARVLRRPARPGIPKELVQELQQAHVEPGAVLDWLADRVTAVGAYELRRLRKQLQRLTKTPAGQAISFIRGEIGYDEYIRQYCGWSGSDPQEAGEVLSALEQIPEPGESARVYIDLASQEELRGDAGDLNTGDARAPNTPAVTLASFHGSKGLEWERVWLLSAVEGAIPHRLTLEEGSPMALEEERRLFYVGMTRAKDVLTISAPRRLLGADATPSRFVVEAGIWTPPPPPAQRSPLRRLWQAAVARPELASPAPQHAPLQPEYAPPAADDDQLPPVLPRESYVPGTVCWHKRFGEGVILWVNAEGGLVEIAFRGIAEPKLLAIDACIQAQLVRVAKG